MYLHIIPVSYCTLRDKHHTIMNLGSNNIEKTELGNSKIRYNCKRTGLGSIRGFGSNRISVCCNRTDLQKGRIDLGSNRRYLGSNGKEHTGYRIYSGSNKVTHRILKQRAVKKTNSR